MDVELESEPETDKNPVRGYMSREEFVWHEEKEDVVVFFIDKENPETGTVETEHVCTLKKLGKTNSKGEQMLGSISSDKMNLRYHRPVEPGYCRKDSIPFSVDLNHTPSDYEPTKRRCGSCGESVNMEATRSPNSAVSNNRCPHCSGSLTKTR